jgi:cation diffusion facilitator CzcD-associated flavoprotein CzcO
MTTRTSPLSAAEHVDVLVVGAGLSGIGAGYHLQRHCPKKSYAILEGRDCIGGTWDLFRYPGIRSDSDMYTLGYSFRPWREAKAIADGPSILKYVRDTARDYGIDQKIRFNHRVKRASWSSTEALWTVETEQAQFTCNFLFLCSGYYNYETGYTPDFKGADRFQGRIVHPQKWTEDIDYSGKRVVVIGSGATAVTLVPELAKKASHVTMLQRSPTYIVARPEEDAIANWLRRHFPAKFAYGVTRWKNVLLGMLFFNMCRRAPERMKQRLLQLVKDELGETCDIDRHFTPRYNPWDQRLCLVPNGDLFQALKQGKASVVTDQIDTFTEQGLKLSSGAELPADLIVTATGLNLQVLGNLALIVDGQPIEPARIMSYKGMMYSEVPNLATAFGYTNASWTLKCDLTCEYVCRLLNYMDERGYRQCTPHNEDPSITATPWIDFSSGYVQRSIDQFPKQGSKAPWRLYQNYALDLVNLRFAAVDDGVMRFSSPAAR